MSRELTQEEKDRLNRMLAGKSPKLPDAEISALETEMQDTAKAFALFNEQADFQQAADALSDWRAAYMRWSEGR